MGHRTTKIKNKVKVHKTIESRTDFFYYAFRNILLVAVPLALVSAFVLSHLSLHSSAYSASTDNVTMTLPASCTLNASVSSAHSITMESGRYEHDIGNTRLNAYCNDNNGYYIYALGIGNNIDGNTDLVSSIGNNHNIHTGVYNSEALNTSTPSSWAMKLTAGTVSSNNSASPTLPTVVEEFKSYHTIPSSSTVVAYRTSNTDMSTNTSLTGSYIDTTYEIYTSPTQPAGTYNGKVKYVMVHPYQPSLLKSFDDAFDIAGKDKVTITDSTTGEPKSYYKMQDMTSNICSLVGLYNEDSETELIDIRDNTIYYVAKLEDNKCWMTENLQLDLIADTTAENYIPLDSTNTDIDVDSYNPNGGAYSPDSGYSKDDDTGVVTWVPENATIAPGNLSSNTWANSNTDPSSYNSGDQYYYPNYDSAINSGNDFSYTLAACEVQGHTDCKHYKAGNYYNWSAEVASNDTSTITGGSATNSICPKGWRLPKYSPNNDFAILGTAYNITTSNALDLRNSPLYLTRSGDLSGAAIHNSLANGNYWFDSPGRRLSFNKTSFNPNNSYAKDAGYSLRCLAR